MVSNLLLKHKWSLLLLALCQLAFTNNRLVQFKHITPEQGLSQSSVFSIVQDSLGFLWFATEDGLNRYDGYTCKVFRHNAGDTNSLVASALKKLFVDRQGRLWIVTSNGHLERFLAREERFKHYAFGNLKEVRVSSIAQDRKGRIWVGLTTGPLFYYDAQHDVFCPFSFNTSIFKKKIHLQTIFFDRQDALWLGTWEGLFKLDLSSGNAQPFTAATAQMSVMALAEDRDGHLWIASAGDGLYRFDPQTASLKAIRCDEAQAESLSSNRTMSLLVDSQNNLWVGTVDKGLNCLPAKAQQFIHFEHDPGVPWSLANGAVMALYEDRNGTIWIGTYGGGVSQYDPNRPPFGHFAHNVNNPQSLSNNIVLAICEDHTGALWIGTDGGGLNVLWPGQTGFEHFFTKAGPKVSNTITALCETTDGTLWIGTDVGGRHPGGTIFCFNRQNERFERFEAVKLSFGGVSTFLEDRSGRLWIGTFTEGLFCFDLKSQKVTHLPLKKSSYTGLSGNTILALAEDPQGKIWIGTLNRGLDCYDPQQKRFQHFENEPNNPHTLGGNSVWCLAVDSKGYLWAGTNGGLSCFNPQRKAFRTFTTEHGLPANMVYGILIDAEGRVWMSTSRGLACLDPTDFSIKKYAASDGLLNVEFTQGAFCKGKNGILYFWGNKGLTYFDPQKIKQSAVEPPVVITDFWVKGKHFNLSQSITFTSKIVLTYRQNFFAFRFSALDFRAPTKNQYAYRLIGVDSGWVYCGNRRFADYTDIAPGHYQFEVKATNSDGVWSPNRATVSIVILPPFWQTWWFRLLLLLLFGGLLFALHSYRVNKLLEVERTRLRIARDLHDDVSATITGIAYFSEALEQQTDVRNNPESKKLFQLIKGSIQNVQESMSDIIWSINPENDQWEGFFPKLHRFAAELCESRSINYSIHFPQQFPHRPLAMETRRNLWLIFKEVVTNGVKHSDCDFMEITFKLQKNALWLEVRDNGKGFNPEQTDRGNGLSNIYRRCKSLKAEVQLITAPGKGTRWIFNIPI